MKIDHISDLHIDFWLKEMSTESPKFKKQLDDFINNIIMVKGGKVLLISGDLGHYFNQNKEFLLRMKQMYENVILVTGNHDLYLVSRKQQEKYKFDSNNRIIEMKQFCLENGITYLDGDVVEIEGVKIGGVGMSWDRSLLEKLLNKKVSDNQLLKLFNDKMNDAKLIFKGRSTIGRSEYGRRVFNSLWNPLEYFESEYNKLQNIHDVDIMVTHYAPIVPPTIPFKFSEDPISTFYYFDGEEDIQRINPKFWIHGHTHQSYNFYYYNTNFLCNPLGYPVENTYGCVQTLNI